MWIYNSLFYSCYQYVSKNRDKYSSDNGKAYGAVGLLNVLLALTVILVFKDLVNGPLILFFIIGIVVINSWYLLFKQKYVEIRSYFLNNPQKQKSGALLFKIWLIAIGVLLMVFIQKEYTIF